MKARRKQLDLNINTFQLDFCWISNVDVKIIRLTVDGTMDNSPVLVRAGMPRTPMISPRRITFMSSTNFSGRRYLFRFPITCSFESSPRRSKNINLDPYRRMVCTRPARDTSSPSRCSLFCNPLYFLANSDSVMLTGNLCGYGCVSGFCFKAATAAERNSKKSCGDISSPVRFLDLLSLPATFLLLTLHATVLLIKHKFPFKAEGKF